MRLIDTGSLTKADHVDRQGLEGLWIRGPWSLQSEVLREDISRYSGNPDFSASAFTPSAVGC